MPDLVDCIRSLAAVDHHDFGAATEFRARLLIADSLICGAAAAGLPRTQMSRRALLPSAPGEAEVFGVGERIRALDAAWINAEAMNLLDADDTFFHGAHFGSVVVASALAASQRAGTSWRRFLGAVVLGFDAAARVQLAVLPNTGQLIPTGLLMVGPVVAAVVGSGDVSAMADALGLACRFAPAPISRRHALAAFDSVKYAPYGALASEALLAARLASSGYHASADPPDGPSFLDTQAVTVDRAVFSRPLGSPWWIEHTSLKSRPSFRLGQSVLDAVSLAMRTWSIDPSDIRELTVHLDPRASSMPFLAVEGSRIGAGADAPLHTAMHLRYCVALEALGVPPGPRWSSDEMLSDDAVWDIVERVRIAQSPARGTEWIHQSVNPDTGKVHGSVARVDIRTGTDVRTTEVSMTDGDPWSASTAPSWEWLERKARNFGVAPSLVAAVRDADLEEPLGDVIVAT